MAEALRLARRGRYSADPNPRVGCVIVHDNKIIGRGWHARAGEAHAEVVALEEAGSAARGATAYVTLEPCCHRGRTPPCTEALIGAGLDRVVIGVEDPNPLVAGAGQARLEAAGITVTSGILAAQSRAENPGFFQRMQHGRPFIRSKLAISVDGRTALANGQSRWITGAAARADVQRWRARSSAVMTGIGTVLADDPSLNVRAPELAEAVQPWRIVVDSRLRMPVRARLLTLPGQTVCFGLSEHGGVDEALTAAGARVELLPGVDGRVSLAALARRLGELELNEVLVEAGPTLNGALLAAGLIDELVVFMAPHVLGDTARGMFSMPALEQMTDRVPLRLQSQRRVGDDLRLIFSRD